MARAIGARSIVSTVTFLYAAFAAVFRTAAAAVYCNTVFIDQYCTLQARPVEIDRTICHSFQCRPFCLRTSVKYIV